MSTLNNSNNWRQWVDSKDEADYECGGEDIIITDEDIELLKSGKILNFDINMEYGCTLSYKREVNNECSGIKNIKNH